VSDVFDKVGELTPEREREVFPAEEMDFLAEFAEGLLKFKYVGLVNLFFKLGGKHLGREFKLWLKRRRLTKEQLGRIQEMDETELLSTLPVVFAKDLSACVPISKTQRIILLFDSHEAFWGVEQRIYFPEERRQEFDDWFRALLKTLNRSRGIVVVVAGRDEPLHWPNAFDRWKIGKVEVDLQQVEGLSVEDSRDYLLRVGITDALLCDTLLQYAQLTPGSVHPLFLHLCTEVIRNASAEGVHLTPSDFQQSVALVEKRVQLVRSLFKYLDVRFQEVVL